MSAAQPSPPCPTCGAEAQRRVSGGAGPRVQGLGFLHHGLREGRQEEPDGGRRRRARSSRRPRGVETKGESGRAAEGDKPAPPSRPRAGRRAVDKPAPPSSGSKGGERMTPEAILRAALAERARSGHRRTCRLSMPQLERPRDPSFGDWATNARDAAGARRCAGSRRDIAADLVARLDLARAGRARGVRGRCRGSSTSGWPPVSRRTPWRRSPAPATPTGAPTTAAAQLVNVEFVSANPTGPLHVGHGRQAALGDAIASLLEWTGWKVDARVLLQRRAARRSRTWRSACRRACGELGSRSRRIPEGGYHGEYIRDIAQRVRRRSIRDDRHARRPRALRQFAVRRCATSRTCDLQAFGVQFDVYFLESSLYADGRVDRDRRACCVAAGHTFEQDGALWLRTTDFGDDKDRVMREVRTAALHLLRAGRGVPRDQVGARIPPRHQRAGGGPPQHRDARARRPAGARHGHSRRAIPSTCCTRW